MKLDKAFLKTGEGPIHSTWGAIAYDVADMGERLTYAGNMEMVLDANRLSAYGGADGKAADALVGVACKEHGYDKVSHYLCRHIKLGI